MSTIQRTVTVNLIEPAPLSFRAPSGMETWVAMQFYKQSGAVVDTDLAAQLHLTARSTNTTTSYAMPATDIVNGKARAVIPSGDITDVNGYRLRLVGTVNQQPALLAVGTVMPVAAAGFEAVPDDVIDTIDIAMTRGFSMLMGVALWHDAGKSNPYDASTGIAAGVYDAQGGNLLVSFTVVQTGYNTVELSLTDTQVNALPDQCWWNLTASTGAGTTTLAQGNVIVTGVAPA